MNFYNNVYCKIQQRVFKRRINMKLTSISKWEDLCVNSNYGKLERYSNKYSNVYYQIYHTTSKTSLRKLRDYYKKLILEDLGDRSRELYSVKYRLITLSFKRTNNGKLIEGSRIYFNSVKNYFDNEVPRRQAPKVKIEKPKIKKRKIVYRGEIC